MLMFTSINVNAPLEPTLQHSDYISIINDLTTLYQKKKFNGLFGK